MVELDYERWLKQLGLNPQSIHPEELLRQQHYKEKTVLGLDIYQYSKKAEDKQRLIPILFDLLYKQTEDWIGQYESPLFRNAPNLRKDFIHTGDGGFQILDNPLCGVVFLVRFFTALNLYNNGRYLPDIHGFVDDLEIRACLTQGKIFPYNNNYFGRPMIQNARILGADKLNRFTIDEHVDKWFNRELGGISSLQVRTSHELERLFHLQTDSLKMSVLFPQEHYATVDDLPLVSSTFRNITKQKVGEVRVKDDISNIYNIEMQVIVKVDNFEQMPLLFVNIGNSNASDLRV